VYKQVPHVTLKSIANNAEIDVIWDKWQATLEPLRESLTAALKTAWQEWEIPRDADAKWPDSAKQVHADWWQARIGRQKDIDASITAKAEFEYIYDKPYEDKKTATSGLPHSREAEEAVIGAVLINPEVYYDLAQFLQPDDFYLHRLRFIWEAYVRLQERRVPIDSLTVTEELEDMGRLEEIGGPAYLTALLNQVPTTLHAEAYGKIVEATAIRRKLLTAANSIATLAYDENEVIDTVMGEAEKAIFNVGERKMRHDVRPIREVLSDYYDHVDELARRGDEIVGVPTGFTDLDKMLGGLQPSDLLITAGRPGMGKTALMLTIVNNAALIHKKRVAVFSLEMSNEQVVQRLIAQQTGIDSQRLRTGKLTDEDWPVFNHAIEVLGDTRIYLDDTPALTPLQLRTKCRRLHMEYGIDLIILDYLQLMSSETRNDNRVQEVSYISRSLKQLARELNVPLMAAAQLSRAVEQRTDKEPQLSDLRESGSLEQDADIVMFIYRDEKDPAMANVTHLKVAKHRNGPVGQIDLIFRNNLTKFENAATRTVDLERL